MHRVIQLQSAGYDASAVSSHKDAVRSMLDNYSDYLHDRQVNDGVNEQDDPTLGGNVDFNDSTQANNFHAELQTYLTDNSADFQWARTRVHDCMHAADKNEPCYIGDVWSL